MSNDELTIFRDFIKSNGLRYTPERECILNEVFSRHDHFSIDELYLSLYKKNPAISKASIYRTIPLLVKAGLVKEVFYGEKHAYYEHIYGHPHHEHMRCIQCKKVIEFEDEDIHKFLDKICRKQKFTIKSHYVEVNGLCHDCQLLDRKDVGG